MTAHRLARAKAWPLVGVLAALASGCGERPADIGRQIFEGQTALIARISGHDNPLPVHASRCVNCHEIQASAAPQPPASAALAGSLKVALSATSLSVKRPRRGGPPSRFDEISLCRLLRTGLDPASVLIPQTMPRYDVDAVQCKALWAYLRAGGPA